jgi:hypothetical protein
MYQDSDDRGMFDSRTFALGLISIASLYVLIMIIQAYRNNQNDPNQFDVYIDQSDSYMYETASYDYRPYQSMNGHPAVKGDFSYNKSIDNSKDEIPRFPSMADDIMCQTATKYISNDKWQNNRE